MSEVFGRSILVVAAHPDDEVLGCGATLVQASLAGTAVHLAFLADGVGARGAADAPVVQEGVGRREAAQKAAGILGAQSVEYLEFPDNRLDTVPLLDIAKAIEALIERFKPNTVFTHHSGDLNIDHRRAHEAVITACRPYPGQCVERILCFEVPSSTEWQPAGSSSLFAPQLFIDVTGELRVKRQALESYSVEMRSWPHARSYEAVEHLARWRGATVGCAAAEAFVIARWIVRNG